MQTINLDDLTLETGAHGEEFRGQCCAVEASNLIAAGIVTPPPGLMRCERPLEPAPFGDDHPSISRAIRAYVISLNDNWDDEQRQKLRPYAARILCTATGEDGEETRAWMATDWLVRVHTPAFLRLAGLEEHARTLEGLARIADAKIARAAQTTIDAARQDADAARAAAWAAAGDAAWDAAGAAAWAAAWDAAWAAAWDAAGAAAGAAAGDAARAVLRPTVEALQASALALLDSMIEVGAPAAEQEVTDDGR